MNLILVESPTKAKTLAKFLGNKYRIEATFGHLRDLPKGELGVDVENNFTPKYVIPRDKAKRVKELKALVKDGMEIILATDPDREGEAISFHLMEILKGKSQIPNPKSQINSKEKKSKKQNHDLKFSRITFHEITKEAIEEALSHPGEINFQLVNAQQARRILDRLVGYKLSPLLWKKLSRRWLSAGRVQSVAVRLIVEREREIEKFKKQEYWVVEGEFNKSSNNPIIKLSNYPITAKLVSKDGVKYEQSETIKLFDGEYTFTKTKIISQTDTEQIISDFQSPFTVTAVDKKEIKRNPAPPYTTSSMQIDAGRKLGFTSKKIMKLAQDLYEQGLITYHRTDSVNLSTKFLDASKDYILKNYGENYSHYRTYTTKSKLAQEAHEAIRPTSLGENPKSQIPMTNNGLTQDHQKLYDLIWKRAVASQMSEAVFDSTTINITSTNNYQFETQGSIVKFDGFLRVAGYDAETIVLPTVKVGDLLDLVQANKLQKFTAPPPRYSEAALIKALEEDGIGRPSTYAPTISTIQDRLYVEKEERPDGRRGRNFVPTELGYLVNDFLVKHFTQIVELPFTRQMEQGLDEIAQGKRDWVPLVAEFYTPFAEKLAHVEENVVKLEIPVEKTGEKCPECKQGEVLIKQGKFGRFYACSRFPECKYTKNLQEKIGMVCPDCKTGEVVVKKTRTGRTFYGCSRYPECKYASWTKPVSSQQLIS